MGNKSAVIPLFGRDFTSKSPTVTAQLLTNMYREPQADPDKAAMVFYQTPGLVTQIDLTGGTIGPTDACRGGIVIGDTTWLAIGTTVVFFGLSGGGVSAIPLATASRRVDMATNGSQLLIVDGLFGYTIALNADGTPTVSPDIVKILSAGFPANPSVCEFLNGFFIVDAPLAGRPGQFNWSALYDGNTWSSLDFANAESSPDPLIQIKVKAGQLYLFGRDTYEVWAPSGDAAVFRRMGGTGAEWGIAAQWSLADYGDNTLVMLAKNKLGQFLPVKIVGYNVEPIGGNDPEIVNSMTQQNAAQATGYSYSLDGHSFYQVNFPNKTYMFDNLSNSWTQLVSGGGRHYGEIRLDNAPILGIGVLNALVFDYRKPVMYTSSATTYTDGGEPIIRTMISKHVFTDYERVSINELYLDCEVGTADVPASGNRAPQIMLDWSKDGGRTYGNQIFQSLGNIGQYQTRARWQNLGLARDWVFRFSFSDNAKLVVVNAAARVS